MTRLIQQTDCRCVRDGRCSIIPILWRYSTLLYEIDNTYVPLVPPKNYVVNPDGSVSVDA